MITRGRRGRAAEGAGGGAEVSSFMLPDSARSPQPVKPYTLGEAMLGNTGAAPRSIVRLSRNSARSHVVPLDCSSPNPLSMTVERILDADDGTHGVFAGDDNGVWRDGVGVGCGCLR